jgi:N-acetylglucosamine malate deacetylase 1
MVVFAIGCHPDDIEFLMAGTLLLLKKNNCDLHYMTVADGSCGTTELEEQEIIKIRKEEAREACSFLGANFHNSIAGDLSVFYTQDLIRKMTAIIRNVAPDILLVHSPQDYMEDHINAGRIAVTAAFCRGMRNYYSFPPTNPIQKDVTIYHSMPYGLKDQLRNTIKPDFYIDITSVIDKKTEMLSFHKSQKKWLDKSQGMDSYLTTMRRMSKETGEMSDNFTYAEGWRQHLHFGFSSKEIDPLQEILNKYSKR